MAGRDTFDTDFMQNIVDQAFRLGSAKDGDFEQIDLQVPLPEGTDKQTLVNSGLDQGITAQDLPNIIPDAIRQLERLVNSKGLKLELLDNDPPDTMDPNTVYAKVTSQNAQYAVYQDWFDNNDKLDMDSGESIQLSIPKAKAQDIVAGAQKELAGRGRTP